MKELFLLRGLPGSGKSTLAKSIGGMHVEADMFFMEPSLEFRTVHTSKFDPSKLKEAHAWCQKTVEVCMLEDEKIVVSNTFTQEKELEPYYQLAEKYGYKVFSLIVENRHGESEDTNTHNVPKETIQKMRARFNIKL